MTLKNGDKVIIRCKDGEYRITTNNTIWTIEEDFSEITFLVRGNEKRPKEWQNEGSIPVDKSDCFPLNSDIIRERLGIK